MVIETGNHNIWAESANYVLKLAETKAEITEAEKLRFQVFKVEQQRLSGAVDGLDHDIYDEVYRHLLVVEKKYNRIIGTYRIGVPEELPEDLPLYSAGEFNLSKLPFKKHEFLELGRSCVAADCRNGAVMIIMWRGIYESLRRFNRRHLIGCVSLEHTNAAIAWTIFDNLKKKGLVSEEIFAAVCTNYLLARESYENSDGWEKLMPPLLSGYLRIGSKVISEPAIDREFGSIDFLTWFDLEKLPAKYDKHFK